MTIEGLSCESCGDPSDDGDLCEVCLPKLEQLAARLQKSLTIASVLRGLSISSGFGEGMRASGHFVSSLERLLEAVRDGASPAELGQELADLAAAARLWTEHAEEARGRVEVPAGDATPQEADDEALPPTAVQ